MKITPELMGKEITATTQEGKTFAGLCWGMYGSVQAEEEYGRAETALEILHAGQSTILFESEIKAIQLQ